MLCLVVPTAESEQERAQQERLVEVDAWIAKCDEVAELWEGEFDSAADLRRIRDQEANHDCFIGSRSSTR